MGARGAQRALILPAENLQEAGLVHGVDARGAQHLLQVSAHLVGQFVLPVPGLLPREPDAGAQPDLRDVRGQHQGKRALAIAAAGGHSLLLIGPPGTGKTMLAQRLPGLLPPLDEDEALETAAVHSLARGRLDVRGWGRRPFRAPHHTASAVALVGGGSHPRPGEVSLAHNGVLFLDELPEFDRKVLEVLREPLESGSITVSRAARQAEFPARFQLVAAMNPCPCGYLGDSRGRCRCTAEQVRRYRARLSGPLLDRIDMHVEMPAVPREALRGDAPADGPDSAAVRAQVQAARARQLDRCGCLNSMLRGRALDQSCRLGRQAAALLDAACERLGLSARAYHRVLRLARTIADLEAARTMAPEHVGEAVGYRVLDRTRE
jgi:magnesium chelatase family protein